MGDIVKPAWFWILFGAVTMSLGWGLRGYIGGGSLGAMIPGALIGLVLCLLLEREEDAGLIAAFAAIGVGFGGQETYGQTVGLSFVPETYHWAILGFALKGGIWGFLGGAVMGIALDRRRPAQRDIAIGLGCMVAATYLGWKLINEPKLIYFSNRLDRPRAELWAGLLLGALALLGWLSYRGAGRLPWRFAVWGGLGGGIGFASGAALQVWGRGVDPDFAVGWWKMMEFTFGACLGAAYAWCAWLHRQELAGSAGEPDGGSAPLPWAAPALVLGLLVHPQLSTRLDYTVAGAVLLAAASWMPPLRWHAAITVTCCAFAIDLLRNRREYPEPAMWVFVVVTTAGVAALAARFPRGRVMFPLLVAWPVAVALLKSFLPPLPPSPQAATQAVFVALAAVGLLAMPRTGPGMRRPMQ